MPIKEIKSLKKCFQLLSLFSQSSNLDADEISQYIAFPKSSLYRYLKTLCQNSILEYDPIQKKYMVGPVILKIKTMAFSQDGLVDIAKPFMLQLVQKKNETVFLTAMKGDEAVCIERVECKNTIRFIINRGDTFPLYASATGRILMAYLPEEEQQRIIAKGLQKITPKTITDPVKLKKLLIQVREQGFAYSDQELNRGAKAVAVPIFNAGGKVVAGLSIAVPVNRFTSAKFKECKASILEYARKVSYQLGYHSNSQMKKK
ncbi:MAG: IclR family transcriptional regulator [Smithellaceae bacterium]|jgi:DNA-binding IclR family transcriptional regulator